VGIKAGALVGARFKEGALIAGGVVLMLLGVNALLGF
jgi:hypothetical protein